MLERFGTQGFREFQRIGHVQRDHRILHVFITGRLAAHRKVGPRRRNDLFGETSYDLRAQPCACVGRRLADRSASCLSVTSRSVCPASRVKIESAGSSAAHFRSTAARRRSVQSEPVLRRSFSSNCHLSSHSRRDACSRIVSRPSSSAWRTVRRRREPAPTSP